MSTLMFKALKLRPIFRLGLRGEHADWLRSCMGQVTLSSSGLFLRASLIQRSWIAGLCSRLRICALVSQLRTQVWSSFGRLHAGCRSVVLMATLVTPDHVGVPNS
jgi:hypothetical protein